MIEIDSKKELILKYATLFFYQNGFKTVSMDDIAKKCSISKKTIYLHFTSKHTLIKEIIKQELNYLEKVIINIQTKNSNAEAELNAFIEFLNKMYAKTSSSFMYDINKSSLHVCINQYFEVIYTFLLANFYRGVKEERYCEIMEINTITHTVKQVIQFLLYNKEDKENAFQNVSCILELYRFYITKKH